MKQTGESIPICCHLLIEYENGTPTRDLGGWIYNSVGECERDNGMRIRKKADGYWKTADTAYDGMRWFYKAHRVNEDCEVIK